MDEDAQTLALLRSLDLVPGPHHLEFPHGFDHESARAQAMRLRDRLTHDFGTAWRLDDGIQDASHLYDGVTWLADEPEGAFHVSYGPHRGRATWWTRYFEHL
ncbi:hypothetical protein [Streptomyces yangpuensis]|uniref:hypothetical protein n=1 Tax=Streptomyces yangpuensis TaxID=1648182 RepID=UPI0037F86224